MNFSIIAAVDQKHGIGINNQLPWNIKADLKHFAEITINRQSAIPNVVIMGRKTWESLPNKFQPLKNRQNVVISHQQLTLPKGVLGYSSLAAALTDLEKRTDLHKVYIIGGASIYQQAINHPACNKIYLTEIQSSFNCDTFFPEIPKTFKKVAQSKIQEENGIKFRFQIYKK